jgi:hypothetical protein
MTRTNLIATNNSKKEIMVCSDLEHSEFHTIFGNFALSEQELEYIENELGHNFEIELEIEGI